MDRQECVVLRGVEGEGKGAEVTTVEGEEVVTVVEGGYRWREARSGGGKCREAMGDCGPRGGGGPPSNSSSMTVHGRDPPFP